MLDLSLTGLRVLREVADRGSFSAAARALGYTQSAVSRQMAALERAAGTSLAERRRDGVVLTSAGARLLRRARAALGELEAASAELHGPAAAGPVRLGAFPAALGGPLPAVLAALPPGVEISVREGTTPALVRALRAGTLDLALLAQAPPFRPPDGESPALELEVVAERELAVAVGASHPLAALGAVEVADLRGQRWVASRSDGGEPLLGVWPGLDERPDVRFVVRDWLAKLRLVAAGLAITTVPPVLAADLPHGVCLVGVRGEPVEARRLVLARQPGRWTPGALGVAAALRDAFR